MRGEERRALILTQAKKVFARTGYAAASMGELARASNVTEALLYKHFEGKRQLYLTVLQETFESFSSTFHKRVRERAQLDLLDALSSLLLDYRAVALSDPESISLLLFASIEVDDPAMLQLTQEHASDTYALLTQLLNEALEQGLLPAGLDLAAASWGFVSLLFALQLRAKLRLFDQVSEQTLRETNRLWLQGLQSG